MELAQVVALSLEGGQAVLRKGMELRQLRSLSPSKRTGLLKQGQAAAATFLLGDRRRLSPQAPSGHAAVSTPRFALLSQSFGDLSQQDILF